ncbi:hypothetical protein V9K67_20880 [Paraflavisolibacter sp. H34]|uniref:IS66 family insertion sequence element accessory protein TnpA n=1 Tax=Huijunlia imazamoxiresistens TaxID=3127457 RepID=UPI003016E779
MDKAIKKQRVKRTDKNKTELIQQWEKSGLPIAFFCRQQNLTNSLFHSWFKEYRRKSITIPMADFISLQIADPFPAIPDDQAIPLPTAF